jgi:HNH endonuclease
MPTQTITVNRAPVMTLWAAVVAERLGHDPNAALTLGKAVAGLNAQAKGRRFGLYDEPLDQLEETAQRQRPTGDQRLVTVLGRAVPVVQTSQGVRATAKGQPVDPTSVRLYLARAFGREFSGKRLCELTVHHKDHNHDNNPPDGSNWELLCLYCHDNEHARQQVADASAVPTPGGEREPPYTYKPFAGLEEILKRKS